MTVNVGWVGNYKRGGKNFGQAYRICQQNKWNLLVAGGVDSGVHVPHEQMPGFYHECDVLLITSVWEAHPLIVPEALASGTPVVMSKYVGDCFRNKYEGLVYFDDLDDDKQITKAVTQALRYRDVLSEAGVNCIHRNWSWGKIASTYHDAFTRLTGKDKPHVTFLINERNWSWGYMAQEIKEYVYPDLEIYVLNEHSSRELQGEAWDDTDLVLNHPWHLMGQLGLLQNIPQNKHVLCVNGPAFINPTYSNAWVESLASCSAITSVSMNIIDWLRFTGKPLYYLTRGIDTSLFAPPLKDYFGDYLMKQEPEVIERLNQLGVKPQC